MLLATMKTTVRSGALAVATMVFHQPGTASAADLSLSPFQAVDAAGGAQVTIIAGADQRVTVEGEDRANFDIDVDGRTLEIKPKGWSLFDHDGDEIDLQVTVRMPAITDLEISSGAEARVSGVDSEALEIEISSGGFVEVAGHCDDLEIEGSTGAYANARDLRCARVDAQASTGASLDVYAADRIDAAASLGGAVAVYGDPAIQRIRESLGGSVIIRH